VSPRRQLALVVLLCAAGALLALLAAGRPWEVAVPDRPPPLPDLRAERTGADLQPWLPALAWVGLAGAGALLATRAAARRVVGGLLVLTGAGLGLASADAAARAGGVAGVAALAGLAGLVVAGAGGAAVGYGRRWPAMGGRYERPDRRERPVPPGHPEAWWDALDRGEDPTAR
jgi:hypothetical protein